MKEKILRNITHESLKDRLVTISSVMRLLIDQAQVTKATNSHLKYFRTGLVPKLGIEAKSFTVEDERLKNLNIVINCLNSLKLEHFVIPSATQTNYRVGMLAEDKEEFLNALIAENKNTGLYVSSVSTYNTNRKKRQILSGRRSLKSFLNDEVINIHSFVLSPYGDVLADDTLGCLVEFWERSDNQAKEQYLKNKLTELRVNVELGLLKNTLIAPTPNPITGILPLDEAKKDTIKIGNKNYSTFDLLNQKTINDIDFPIDVVYAWVDGNDPKWKKKFNKYKGIEESVSYRNNTESRYKDRQELKYSLRSIHMYAPFVRNIYIVTDNQVPEWLNQSVPGVKIIDHKDIFDPKVLPVFNSHAIGAQLHHIKGLSDRYLYLNDDTMFGRYVVPQRFFFANGIARVSPSPALIHAGEPKDYESAPSSAGKNVRAALQKTFGRHITNKFKHMPNPQIKEVAYEIEKKYKDLVEKTASSRFRSKEDIQFAGLFHHSYSVITGRAIPSSGVRAAVVNISDTNARTALERLLTTREAHTICLNESETPASRQEEVADMVENFFERYYPYPSPWEKTDKNDILR